MVKYSKEQGGVDMKWIYRLWGERPIFLTHTAGSYKIGDKSDWPYEGYKITRIIETSPTALYNGGSAECSEVWGKPIKSTLKAL